MHSEFFSENMKRREHLEDGAVDWSYIFVLILKSHVVRISNKFILLRAGSSDKLMLTRMTLVCRKEKIY
jgi:hypothetical protein